MSEEPKRVYAPFSSESDYQAAIDTLLDQEGRELRIFDPDLVSLQLSSAARVDHLERFLRVSRTRRIYIVTHDAGHMTKRCPRMMSLLARFAHMVQVNRTHEEIRKLQDSFMVLDALHYVRRPVATWYRGALGINDDSEAQQMRARFQEIWSASYPGVSATTTGL
jgi:hypothetical protein